MTEECAMSDEDKIGAGIPFFVRLRAYRIHAVIAVIMLIIYGLLFGFLAGNCTRACAELRRIHDAPHCEIVFSGEEFADAESFFYLPSIHMVGTENIGVSADILMTQQDVSYGENDIYFQGTLAAGTCAVSKNLASAYGLHIGEYAAIAGEENTFLVTRLLTAQAGIDKNFDREGIIILAYDEDLAQQASAYVSFTTDGDAYTSLISLVFIEDWRAENVLTVSLCAAIFLVSFALAMLVCEFFLFRSRMRDYRLMTELGMRKRMALGRIWAENALKYLLPLVAIGAVFTVFYSCYEAMYAVPFACCFAAALAILTGYTFLFGRRLVRCRINGKKS